MLVAIKYNSTLIELTLSLHSTRNYLAVTVWPSKRGEKSIKIKEIKKGEVKLIFAAWKKSVYIFFKNKNDQFPQNNLFQEK